MLQIEFKPTEKQMEAWYLLMDKETTDLGFGGGAGGGKTVLGCEWILSMALAYPGTAFAIGRKELTTLRRTTLVTFFEVLNRHGLVAEHHYIHRDSPICLFRFFNNSVVYFIELQYNPSDPEYTKLGSLELTAAFVDESAETPSKAIEILSTRIGRKLNDEYGLVPKMLQTFNPDKGHVYMKFYKPWKTDTLPQYRKFVTALATDNPHISKNYIDQLKKADKVTVERLLYGNFEYDDDPARLMETQAIMDLFTNQVSPGDLRFIVCDVARKGNDRTVISVWHGLRAVEWVVKTKLMTDETAKEIPALDAKHQVRRSNILIDEDGVGGGVLDQVRGARGFVNNSAPVQPRESKRDATRVLQYANLKAQCWHEFSRRVNTGGIRIDGLSEKDKELLAEELGQVKQNKPDSDGKFKVVGKETVKEKLGRSSDLGDVCMMRMWFELNPFVFEPIFV